MPSRQSAWPALRALFGQAAAGWRLNPFLHSDTLVWAARLHESGLAVSHNQYHKHGAYLIGHSDLAGFSRQEQALLASLVRGHRRKFPVAVFEQLPQPDADVAQRLCVLLRLAGALNRSQRFRRATRLHEGEESPVRRGDLLRHLRW